MKLNQQQNSFLEKRRKLVKSWSYVGPLMMLLVLGLAAYVYVKSPLLINPYEVLARLQSGSIEQSTLMTMAVILPIVFITVCFLLIVLIVMLYAAIANEKKYIEILNGSTTDISSKDKAEN
jgi:uncharacterized BrkB/YihY/UPF0761 family membrane protein